MIRNGIAARRYEALRLAVRLESLKKQEDRELDVADVIAKARTLDEYMTEPTKLPDTKESISS